MADGGKTPSSRKNRTAMSCDRCKSRKTKCNNPVPGPCDYCKSIDATCQIDAGKRKQRPYYFVSEEEFRLMTKILQHCYPERKLDLLELRNVLNDLEGNTGTHSESSSVHQASPSKPETTQSIMNRASENGQAAAQEGVALEEIASLHEDLGCMMRDSSGEYRYIGADSGISFNAAVRSLHPDSLASKVDKDIIPGMKTASLPPTTPESTPGSVPHTEIQLPPRELCFQYVSRYFDEVHCLYWLYSSEQFHTRLEHTYSYRMPATASWICSLYAIFAMGSLNSTNASHSINGKSSSEWLAMAKGLVSRVCDEADLDSVRALILLALALQSHCFSNNAYLHAGTAVRVGFSLGLHVDKYSMSHGYVEKEHARRIWWTLYIYDQEVALRTGKPCAIAPFGSAWQPPLPSEQVLSPGPNNPSGYLEVSSGLTHLTKITSQTLYIEPLSGGKKLLSPKVAAILSSLRQWAHNVPSHLSRTTHVAPSHRRAVALLHVRYWSVIILATRPFLLCSVLRRKQLRETRKKKCYEELSNICIDAAQNSLNVLQMMGDRGLLSSLLPSEFNYILELVQIFLISFARDQFEEHIFKVRSCLSILNLMDDIGWTQKARPEVINQLRESGVLDEGVDYATSAQDFTNFLTGGENPVDAYNMIFAGQQPDGNGIGYQSQALAEMDFDDTAASEELLQQISDLSGMSQFVTP